MTYMEVIILIDKPWVAERQSSKAAADLNSPEIVV